MTEQEEFEKAILDRFEPRWKEQGYRVLRYPTGYDVPDFLQDFRPDALLMGHNTNLVVEIVRKGQSAASSKLGRLRDLLASHPGWKLEVIYSGSPIEQMTAASIEEIDASLQRIRRLAGTEPQAALMVAWATLEALVRGLEPGQAQKAQSPGRVVELLASAGHILPNAAEVLRKAASFRNRFIHGELNASITPADIEPVIETIEALIRALRERESIH